MPARCWRAPGRPGHGLPALLREPARLPRGVLQAEVGLPPRIGVVPSVISSDAEGQSGGTVGYGRKVKACSLFGDSLENY